MQPPVIPSLLDPASPQHPLHPPDGEVERVPLPLLVMLVAASLLMVYLVWPVRTPLFLAAVMALVLQPPFLWVNRILRGRRYLAGACITLLLLAGIVLPALAIVMASLNELVGGAAWLSSQLKVEGDRQLSYTELGARAASMMAEKLHLDADNVQSHLSGIIDSVQRASPQIMSASLQIFGASVLFLIAFLFLLVDGHFLTRFVGRISPLRDSQTNELLGEFRKVTIGALLGNIINGIAQGLIIFLGFVTVGIPHAAFFGIITIFSSLIPLVGSQLVYVPATIALIVQDRVAAGVGLAVWCTLAVLVVDNGIKPRVLRGTVEFHGGLLLLGFIGGLGCFGLPGLIAGPLVVAFALTLFRIYQRDYLNRGIVTQRHWRIGL